MHDGRHFHADLKNFHNLVVKCFAVADSIGIMWSMSEKRTIRSFFNGLLGLSTLLLRR